MKSRKQTILVISDFHAPYNHPDAVAFLRACKKKYKPTDVVCIGDETDFHAMSFHDSNPDLPSAGDELKLAIKELKKLYRLFPDCTVVESNHGSMVLRKALAKGFPQVVLKSYNEILEAPRSWKWVPDVTLKTPIGPVYFCHGKVGGAGKLASQYGMSCVQGHFHEKAQITYISTPEKLMFDAHTGCLADDDSLALAYNKVNPKRPILSVLVIVDGVPQIVPMLLAKNGRWMGTV
ncbi:metallophosphoesterase [Bdellovibrio bacteriovorus]|uniref:metallophosphoesterase n=1 Tax=Bdellovibrio bacteriovorus TaxID=959 RepID=UPI0035A73158